jgi:predicted amidohydrolase YtcJ
MVKHNGKIPLGVEQQLKIANEERRQAAGIIELLRKQLQSQTEQMTKLQIELHRTQISAAAAYWKAGITSVDQGAAAVNEYMEMLKQKKAENQKLHDAGVTVIEDFLKKTEPGASSE